MRLLVAIPCLNEAKTIAAVIQRIPRSIGSVKEVVVLVVDDGSTDNTSEIAQANGAIVLRHSRNCGVGAAFNTAINYAVENDFDIMVNIDGDGQFAPEDIPKLIKPIINCEADFVTASRFKDKSLWPEMPRVKFLGNHMMSYLISKLCGQKFADVSCGFRAYSKETLLQLNLHGQFTYTQETFLDLISKRLRIVEVPLKVQYFKDRESRVAKSILRYATNTALIITRVYRDYSPFKFFMSVALVFYLFAALFGGAFFINYLNTGKFTGYLFAGFLSGFFTIFGFVFSFAAIVMDMLVRVRVNQEKILYMLKKQKSKG